MKEENTKKEWHFFNPETKDKKYKESMTGLAICSFLVAAVGIAVTAGYYITNPNQIKENPETFAMIAVFDAAVAAVGGLAIIFNKTNRCGTLNEEEKTSSETQSLLNTP